MNRNLLKAIEKVLDDADLAKKFLELESIEDMYEFLQKFDNNFNVEELEYTIEEISKAVTSSYMKLEDESLFEVAGGNKMTDVMKRITGTGMAALTLMGPVTSFASHAAPQNALETTITGEKVPKSHSIVKKFKDAIVNWTKENPEKAVGGSVLIALLFTVAVNKIKNSNTSNEITKSLNELWSQVKGTIKFSEFKNMVKKVEKEMSQKYEDKYHDKNFGDKWGKIAENIDQNGLLLSDGSNFDQNKEQYFNVFIKIVEEFARQYLDGKANEDIARKIKKQPRYSTDSINDMLSEGTFAGNLETVKKRLMSSGVILAGGGTTIGENRGADNEHQQGVTEQRANEILRELHRGRPYTDDTTMTAAIMQTIMEGEEFLKLDSKAEFQNILWDRIIEMYNLDPSAGYGGAFKKKCEANDRTVGTSFGNGASMRIAPIVWWCYSKNFSEQDCQKFAHWITEITHNHDDSYTGVDMVVKIMWMGLDGSPKVKIQQALRDEFKEKYTDEFNPNWIWYEDKKTNRVNMNLNNKDTTLAVLWLFFNTDSVMDAYKQALVWGRRHRYNYGYIWSNSTSKRYVFPKR